MDKEFKREIIVDNYQRPFHKETKDDSYIKVNTNNESCIDNIDIYIMFADDKIKDIYFDGEACAISTSATSIMLRNLVGKSIEEIKIILDNYENMIDEKDYNNEILNDLNVYDEIYLQPNRKNCALLPAQAIRRAIEKHEAKA